MGKRSVWTSWVLPLIIGAGLVAAFGLVVASVLDIPYAQAWPLAILVVVGIGGYFFAEQWVYAQACRRLGYRCDLRPQPLPHSAGGGADLVITGSLRGRPFALYRERHDSTQSRYTVATASPRTAPQIIVSVVEWADPGFKLPAFEIKIGPKNDAAMPDPFGITSALESAVSAVRTAAGHPHVPPPPEPAGFSQSKRDEITAIMGKGLVQGEPGYLVLRETARSPVWTSREGKFPYPWELETYLDRADRIRHAFLT